MKNKNFKKRVYGTVMFLMIVVIGINFVLAVSCTTDQECKDYSKDCSWKCLDQRCIVDPNLKYGLTPYPDCKVRNSVDCKTDKECQDQFKNCYYKCSNNNCKLVDMYSGNRFVVNSYPSCIKGTECGGFHNEKQCPNGYSCVYDTHIPGSDVYPSGVFGTCFKDCVKEGGSVLSEEDKCCAGLKLDGNKCISSCGNNICEDYETYESCPGDCPCKNNAKPISMGFNPKYYNAERCSSNDAPRVPLPGIITPVCVQEGNRVSTVFKACTYNKDAEYVPSGSPPNTRPGKGAYSWEYFSCPKDSICKNGKCINTKCIDGSDTSIINTDKCQPQCTGIGSKSEGWSDPCGYSGSKVVWDQCAGITAVCLNGKSGKGWYNPKSEKFIFKDKECVSKTTEEDTILTKNCASEGEKTIFARKPCCSGLSFYPDSRRQGSPGVCKSRTINTKTYEKECSGLDLLCRMKKIMSGNSNIKKSDINKCINGKCYSGRAYSNGNEIKIAGTCVAGTCKFKEVV